MNFLDEVFQKQIKLNEKIGDSLISLTLKEKRLSTQLTVNAMNAELIELLNWSQFKLWKTKYIPNKEKDKAYLIGMAYGDLSVSEKYKRMTFGTTSAKWYKLVLEFINIAFSNKTKVIKQYTYIRDKSGLAKKYNKGPNKYVSYQLATSEEFIYKELLPYTNDLNKAFKKYDSIEIIRGIFDSEGTISYRVGKTKNPYYQITCCSTDFQMLQKMQAKLITLDIKTTLNKSGLKGINNRTKDIYTIYIRQNSVKIFLNFWLAFLIFDF